MTVPFLDLKAQHATLAPALERAVREVFDEQCFILGPVVERFERRIAEYLGIEHAVGVSSGSDALLVSLLAAGIGPADEVVTTPFTFFATAGAIRRAGARPVFVDIDPSSFNLDPAGLSKVLSPRTRALLPVHLFGRAAELSPLLALARSRDLTLIEDAAQALGTGVLSSPASGDAVGSEQFAGTLGDYGCFSFFPSKNLGGAGDAGLVVCRDVGSATRVRRLRAHGATEPHLHEAVGGNFRLDALQAAVLQVKLPLLEGWIAGRRRNAERYRRLLVERGLSVSEQREPSKEHPVAPPGVAPGHSYNQFVVRVLERDGLVAHLRRSGIGHAIYYPRPLHLQPALADLGYVPGSFPQAERAAREVLALPVYPELTELQQEQVVEALAAYYGRTAGVSVSRSARSS